MKHAILPLCALVLLVSAGCASPGDIGQKVLSDFGLAEKPAGYVSGSDKVFEQLATVGASEMKRMNALNRNGEIKFEQDGLRGRYFKEVKVYEKYYPLDVKPSTAGQDRGFVGFIDYSFQVYRSEAKATRVEAAAMDASEAADKKGRESYRYYFNSGGVWDGAKGEVSSR